MRQRQLETFGRTNCAALCTVEGMLGAHGTGSTGDITPVHMCELLKEVRRGKGQTTCRREMFFWRLVDVVVVVAGVVGGGWWAVGGGRRRC